MVEERVLSRVVASMESELKNNSAPAPRQDASVPHSAPRERLRPFTPYVIPAKSVTVQIAKPRLEGSSSRLKEMNKILRKLQSESAGVEASALISEDGLMIASALPQGMEETRVAGMTATLLNLGSRGAAELNRGGVQEIIVRGDRGYAILISVGRGALLLALTDENAKLGLVFFDMREAISAVQTVL
jgi:predicted regulator of Ras-like GTPase activity (Roadblock/LC7/MglB family)